MSLFKKEPESEPVDVCKEKFNYAQPLGFNPTEAMRQIQENINAFYQTEEYNNSVIILLPKYQFANREKITAELIKRFNIVPTSIRYRELTRLDQYLYSEIRFQTSGQMFLTPLPEIREIVKEIPVEKIITKEVIKEVPVEKEVVKEVERELSENEIGELTFKGIKVKDLFSQLKENPKPEPVEIPLPPPEPVKEESKPKTKFFDSDLEKEFKAIIGKDERKIKDICNKFFVYKLSFKEIAERYNCSTDLIKAICASCKTFYMPKKK